MRLCLGWESETATYVQYEMHSCMLFILCLLLHQHCGKYHSSLNRHEPCLLLSLLTLPGRRQGGDLVTAYVSLQARTPQQWVLVEAKWDIQYMNSLFLMCSSVEKAILGYCIWWVRMSNKLIQEYKRWFRWVSFKSCTLSFLLQK